MSKYIVASKLIAAIEDLKNQLKSVMKKFYYAANYKEWEAELRGYNKILRFITVLQQEQPEACKGWVARNRPNTSPSLVFFYDKPIRQDNGWGDKFWHSPNTWSEEISIPANLFPSLRWEDEPIEVELVIRNARKEE